MDPAREPEEDAPSPWRWAWRALAVAALVGLLVLLWSAWDHAAVMAWKQRAGPLPFFASMALLPAIGVPISPFFVLAGSTFGVRVGLLGSAVALGLNLIVCYFIARGGLRPRVESLLRRFRYDLPDFRAQKRGRVRFSLLVKLAPGVPAFVKNYALGLAGVPFGLYFGLSMAITGVYAAALVVLGESVFDHNRRRTAIAVAIVVVLGLGVWWLRRRQARAGQTS